MNYTYLLKFGKIKWLSGLLFCAFLLQGNLSAQVANYSFNSSSGTYTPITGGTVLGNDLNDDNNFTANPIGFTFWYNGVAYTTFSVNANGFIALGNTILSSYTSLSTGTTNNVIAALNFDIQAQTGASLRYQTIGSAPNRTLVVQWEFYRPYLSTLGDDYDFQIRLNETTNVVDVVYGGMLVASTSAAQVGLRGNTNADYNNRRAANGFQTWATTIAGTTNADVCGLEFGFFPASGQTFSWAPAPVTAPSNLTFSAVTQNAMTLNWDDQSTNETSFAIYNSLDGINYTFVATVPSTTSAGTGTAYNYNATGLFSSTLYYWQVYAVENAPSNPLSGTQATLGGTLCGTYTVGPTGTYTSLTAAFADVVANGLNCPLVFELQAAYVSSVETFPLNVPNMFNSPTNTITVRPELGATNLSITSASTQTVNFNGARNVIFDGRPGGVGTNLELTIANTSTTGSAIQFVNNTQNCGINFINVRGVNTSTTSGVVVFGTATTGNTNNFITNSDLSDGATLPVNMIYSSTATGSNSGTVIDNNRISDWFSPTLISAAILLNTNNSNWQITDNSFYQTATRLYTSTTVNSHGAVYLNTATGQFGHNISDNFIGGSAPLCGGSAYTLNGSTATAAPRFIGIYLQGNGTSGMTINNNVITNFSILSGTTATAPGIFNGIYTLTGAQAVDITNNTIGSSSTTGAITITQSGTTGGARFNGIYSQFTGALNINNNTVGGISLNYTANTLRLNFYGIYQTGTAASVNINNNLIGSTTVLGSIQSAPSIATTGGELTGIYSTATTAGKQITNNTISNLVNQYAGTSTSGVTRGIWNSGGIATISGNTVVDLYTLSTGTGTTTTQVLQGILSSSVTTGGFQNITGNTITRLGQSGVADCNISGLTITGNTTAFHQISDNQISAIGAPTNTGNPTINGILVYGGTHRIFNNMIALGSDNTGAPLTGSHAFTGIRKTSTTNISLIHNSISITGTGVNAGLFEANSSAFLRTSNSTTLNDTLMNNIFSNTRSNNTSLGKHYSINVNNTTNLFSNNNVIWGNGTGYVMGFDGTTDYNTLGLWAAATGDDANSFAFDPNFISVNDLHINNTLTSILESRAIVTNITDDIDSDVRPGPVGSVNGGATAPDIGADEFDGIPLALDMGAVLLVTPADSGCYSSSEVVTIRVRNFSSRTIRFFNNPTTLSSFVTGVNPVVFPNIILNTDSLVAGATLDTIVSLSYDMSAVGTYNFRAYTTLPGDVIASNDTMNTTTIVVSPGTVNASATNNICNFSPVDLDLTGSTFGGTTQWEESTDGITFTPISGGTTLPYTVSPGDTTYYRAITCGSYISDTVRIDPTVVNNPIANDTSRCGAGPVMLIASGDGTIRWFDQMTGGTLLGTGDTLNTNVINTTTFYVENSTGSTPSSHTTTFAAGNGSAANMFGIRALNTVTITGFDGHTNSTSTNTSWEVWYRPNDYLLTPGSNTSNVGWTLIGTASGVTGAGTGNPTVIPIPVNITIPAGQTYSFYVAETSGAGVAYTNGTVLGNLWNANTDFEVIQGHGGAQPFSCTFSPRVFNGNIRYGTGCSSNRLPVNVTVTPPAPLTLTTSANTICSIDSVNLNVTSPNSSYTYSWTPTAILSDSVGANVIGFPNVGTTNIIVTGIDTANCINSDTVSVVVNQSPSGTLFVTDNEICAGTSDTLWFVSDPSGATVSFTNTGINAFISDALGIAGTRDTISVTGAPGTLGSGDIVSVCLDITHTWDGDIDIVLVSPAGTSFDLSLGNGGSGDNYTNTCFDMNAPTSITTGVAPFNGSYIPQGAGGFDTFNGENANGNWQLYIVDNVGGDNGTLNSWSITFRVGSSNLTWSSNPAGLSATGDSVIVAPTVTTIYTVLMTDTLNGCTRQYETTVDVNQLPVVNLGNDTTLCSNNAAGFFLDATNPNWSHQWGDGSTAPTFLVTSPGTYNVAVTDTNGCVGVDTIDVVGVNPVQVNIGVNFTSTTTAELDAGAGFTSYLWNTLATTQTITANLSGTYFVTVYDQNFCESSDTINIVFSLSLENPDGSQSTITYYPNPSNGFLNMAVTGFPAGEDMLMEVMDMNGKVVYVQNFQEIMDDFTTPLNLSHLSEGTYMIRVSTKLGAQTKRIVIVR